LTRRIYPARFLLGERMAARRIQIAPERIAEGKQLYELTSTPVPDIAAMIGVSRRTLERRVHEWGWAPRSAPRVDTDRAMIAAAPPAPQNTVLSEAIMAATPSELRNANAIRIQRLVAGSLDAVDRVLAKVGPADEGGAERSARTLAGVARTLQEMAAICQPETETPQDDADDNNDPTPRDIDEFRRELARRLRGIIESRRARISGRLDGPSAEPEPPSV
jgi:hypothetical protein